MFNKQKVYFENLISSGLLGHAYLFTGSAYLSARSAGENKFTESICVMLTGKGFDNNPDLKFIRPDAKEDKHRIDIASIRELKSFMSLKSYSGGYKLAIVENAETISDAAANAMLKILEEPPKQSVIILVTSRPRQLPATIISRCETVIFPPVKETKTEEMDKALSELRKVARQNLSDRIRYAKHLHEKENYAELVNLWLRSLRLQLADKPATAPVTRKILRLSYIISQPQYNHRIALENFFVNL